MSPSTSPRAEHTLQIRDTPEVDPPIDPPVEPPVDPPVDPPVEPPVDPPVEPPVEPPPTAVTLSVSPSSVAEDAGATTLTLTAAFVGTGTFATDTSVTVTVGKSGDTAVASTDYTAAGTVTVPITTGNSSGQATFTLTPTNDTLVEGSETLTLHGAATGLSVSDATVTITDDDRVVRVRSLAVASFERASYTLNEDGSPVEIAVRLSSAQSEEVELSYTMVSATAQIGRDGDVWSLAGEPGDWRYEQQLIFAPGETQKFIKLYPVDNNLVEPDAAVAISLSVVSGNATPGPSTTLTLTDDDVATVLLLPERSQANEGESAEIRLRLTKPHQQEVTMDCLLRGTATPGVDYAMLSHTVVIPAGTQTVVIPVEVLSDEIVEGSETLVFVIANPVGGGVVISPDYAEHTVTIVDVAS